MTVQIDQLNKLYRDAIAKASKDRDWYRNRKDRWKYWSRGTRIAVWAALLVGAACPFVPDNLWSVNWLKLGYASVVIGGLIFSLDQFLLFSRTWIRYVTTQVKLDARIDTFAFEWEAALAGFTYSSPGTGKYAELVGLLKTFMQDIKSLVIGEAESWATDLNDALQSMERKIAKSEKELKEIYETKVQEDKKEKNEKENEKLTAVEHRTQNIGDRVTELAETLRESN